MEPALLSPTLHPSIGSPMCVLVGGESYGDEYSKSIIKNIWLHSEFTAKCW